MIHIYFKIYLDVKKKSKILRPYYVGTDRQRKGRTSYRRSMGSPTTILALMSMPAVVANNALTTSINPFALARMRAEFPPCGQGQDLIMMMGGTWVDVTLNDDE